MRSNSGTCLICQRHHELLHWHHTIPQSLGGKDSQQIPLCAQCHNLLHAHGLAIVAARKNGTNVKRKFWATQLEEINAAPYLEILVKALLRGNAVGGKQFVMSFKATPALHSALQLFKMDSNAKSLETAMILLVSEQLRNKGYLAHEHSENSKQQSQKSSGSSLQNLWGLQRL